MTERVSARRVLDYESIYQSRLEGAEILEIELDRVRDQVRAEVGPRRARTALVYITYEEIVDDDTDGDDTGPGVPSVQRPADGTAAEVVLGGVLARRVA